MDANNQNELELTPRERVFQMQVCILQFYNMFLFIISFAFHLLLIAHLLFQPNLVNMILSFLDIEELFVVRPVSRIWAKLSSHELTIRPNLVMQFNYGNTDWRKGYSKTQTLPEFIKLLQGSSSHPWEFPFVRFHFNFSDFGGSDFDFEFVMGKGKGDKNKKTEELPGSLLQFYTIHGARIKSLGCESDRHTSHRAIHCTQTLVQRMVTPTSMNHGALALEELDFSGWDAMFTGPMGTPPRKSATLANLKTLQFGPLGSHQRGYFLDWILQAAPGLKECKYAASNPTDGYGHDAGR